MKQIAALTALLMLCGCATQMPSLAGKTIYEQKFEDVEAGSIVDGVAVPGQGTKYSLSIKAPAGVKLDDITGMSYTWNPEQGQININKSGTTDTSLQATAILEAQKQIVDAMLSGFSTAAQLAAPLVGQNISGNQANKAAEIQSKAATRQQLIDLGAQLLPQIQSSIAAQLSQSMPGIIEAVTQRLNAAQSTAAPATQGPRLSTDEPATPPSAEPTPLRDGTLPSDTNLSPEG